MYSHVALGSNDFERAKKFYDAIMEATATSSRRYAIARTGSRTAW
jgi:hypothetical protein